MQTEIKELRRIIEEQQATISALEGKLADANCQDWISVEERLPDFVYHDGKVVIGYFEAHNKWHVGPVYVYKQYSDEVNVWIDTKNHDRVKVSHWMLLPSPPKSSTNLNT